jgi:hypothetical protein
MGRIVLEVVVPILLPAGLYMLWLVAEQRRIAAAGGALPRHWVEAPWLRLLAVGVLLAGLLAMALALFGGDSIQGDYVPPQIKDGRIVPGHVVPRAPTPP